MSTPQNAPIIIRKRRRKAGHEAGHGGAWKVAYADFVTAMMAFFLLMWIIATVSEENRRGIADFFASGAPLSDLSGGSNTPLGGESGAAAVEQGAARTTAAPPSAVEAAEFTDVMAALSGGDSLEADLIRRHVATRLSDEGLIITLSAVPGAPLFTSDGALTPIARAMLGLIARELLEGEAGVAIGGHMAKRAAPLRSDGLWQGSLIRAETARRALVAAGLAEPRLRRVSGFSDLSEEDHAPERIDITLLRAGF